MWSWIPNTYQILPKDLPLLKMGRALTPGPDIPASPLKRTICSVSFFSKDNSDVHFYASLLLCVNSNYIK